MNKEQIMEAMNHIDPALIEAADRSTSTTKRTRRGWIRPAVIAACLCLVLAGTAAAHTWIAGFNAADFFTDEIYENKSYQGYTLWGGRKFFPLDELSQRALDTAAENPCAAIALEVSNLDRLEAFSGLELPESLELDNMVRRSFKAAMSCDQEGPTCITYWESFRGKEDLTLQMEVKVAIYTERMYSPDLELSTGYFIPSEYTVETEEYTTANGQTALLTHFYKFMASSSEDGYYADFVSDGLIYHLTASCPGKSEQALLTIQQAIEALKK